MSSILKVDTIQDQNGNLIISKDSGGSGFLSPYASSSAPITYTVTVASKTSAHPYNGVGSSNGYFINGIESPIIEIKGNDTSKPYHYKFDQSDSSNSGHPLLFYNNVGKTTGFSTGVTTNGTPGQAGAYTMIAVDSQTPNILYYQCSSHANMGNHTFATSPVVNTGVFLTLPTADGSSGQVVTTNGSGVLSFAASTPATGSISTAMLADNAVTTAKITDANVTTAKLADSSVTNSKVASTIITGQTAASTIADDDLILISDTGESAALKKMTRANFVAGIGGTNDNRWFASYNGDQTINHNTVTTVLFTNEVIDSASAFASSTFTVPSGQGGTYLVGAGFWSYDTADVINQQDLILTKDLGAGSENDIGFFSSRPVQNQTERIYNNFTLLLNLSAGETLNVRAKIQTNDSGTVLISGSGSGSRFRNFFWGYKIIT